MFTKELGTKILKILDEREMTIENLAEISNLSRKFVGNVINQRQTPTLDSFEKICAALEVTPNDLLMSEESMLPEKSKAMQVAKVFYNDMAPAKYSFPICPNCNITLEREYQSYCDRCGQMLSWKGYSQAEVIYASQIKTDLVTNSHKKHF